MFGSLRLLGRRERRPGWGNHGARGRVFNAQGPLPEVLLGLRTLKVVGGSWTVLDSPDRSVAGVYWDQDSRWHRATLERFEKNLEASPGLGPKKIQLPLPILGDGCYFIKRQRLLIRLGDISPENKRWEEKAAGPQQKVERLAALGAALSLSPGSTWNLSTGSPSTFTHCPGDPRSVEGGPGRKAGPLAISSTPGLFPETDSSHPHCCDLQ